MTHKTLIIAEAGVNHNGDLSIAKRLIEVAAEAGADFIKFQTFKAGHLVTNTAKKAKYQTRFDDEFESQQDLLKKLELTEFMHHELIAYCDVCKIGFLSTGFDIESVNFLNGLGQKFFKIPSGEISNLPYLQHIGRLKKNIILSAGMSTLGDIEAAIDAIESAGTDRTKITVLHCTTEYPAPISEVNLRAMNSIHQAFGTDVGYSDHTQGIEISIAAVAMGATVIEKHFTLDRTLPGPDHQASLEPLELAAMISAIRNIEIAMGDGIKRVMKSESENKLVARKSLVAARAIEANEIFTLENIAVKRPGTGISPMRINEVVGRIAQRDFAMDELIEL